MSAGNTENSQTKFDYFQNRFLPIFYWIEHSMNNCHVRSISFFSLICHISRKRMHAFFRKKIVANILQNLFSTNLVVQLKHFLNSIWDNRVIIFFLIEYHCICTHAHAQLYNNIYINLQLSSHHQQMNHKYK